MAKQGITISIPGFGLRVVTTVVSDYTGTLSCGGRLAPGVREAFYKLAELVDIHVVTADTFGTARKELEGLPVTIHLLEGEHQDLQRQQYGTRLGLPNCAVYGNGNNDRPLLQAAKEAGGLAIAVDAGEGCATEALLNSHLFIVGAANALNLLIEPNACKATLRR